MSRRGYTFQMFRSTLLVALTAIAVVGCSSGPAASSPASAPASSSPSDTAPSSAVPSTSGPASPGALTPETTSFTIGTSGGGINHLAYLIAMDELNKQGWNIFLVELASGDLVVQAVMNGQVTFGTGQLPAVLLAQQKGAPLTQLLEFAGNTWTVYAKPEYATCDGLNGRKFAVHALTSFTYLYPLAWMSDTCPSSKPDWMIVPGSSNRLAAIQTGEIDATTLELTDAMVLQAKTDNAFKSVVNFAEVLPFVTGTHWGYSDFITSHPNTTTVWVQTILAQHKKLMTDPVYFKTQLDKYLPEYAKAGVSDQIVELYTKLNIFPPDGGMSEQAMSATIDFLVEHDLLKSGLSAAETMDRSYIQRALQVSGS